ncbi:MAG: peptidoglycan DD-metalloendopeptidase family protein [Gammaproteobacteria bacterium]|nr:peptidoglycan DD-metalloendopeptidase family protein [Gammaproteobacteria bacterium]
MRRAFPHNHTSRGWRSGVSGARLLAGLGVLALSAIVGCTPRSDPPAPVGELSISSGSSQGHHVVQSGDTLYSVAFRYGLDYRDVAIWNGVDDSYTIYVGQKLRLEPELNARVDPPGENKKPAAAVRPDRPAQVERRTEPPVTRPVEVNRSTPKATGKSAVAKNSKPVEEDKETPYTSGPIRWQWPTNGPVLSTFSSRQTGRKGIDIGGKIGEPVRAAAGGKIVYSGSGLVGYGKLIIVKHNDNYLSAYAHNSELLVREGQVVNAGEKIATKGASGKQPQLHFEIRHNGKPVNPLTYLPKR